MRRLRIAFVWACVALTFSSAFSAVSAGDEQNSGLKRLGNRHNLNGWEAVGRLDIGKQSYCTAVLIATDLILTAAHCVYDKNGRLRTPGMLTYRAGLHDGHFVASRAIRRIQPHPDFNATHPMADANIRNDVAILELGTAIPSTTARPFALHPGAERGARVSVVSYGRGRDAAPSWQENCGVLQHAQNLMVFDCDVTNGSSGAPVFLRGNGELEIVSLISAGARVDGKMVSFGMELPAIVAQLKRDMGPMGASGAAPQATERITVRSGTEKRTTSAKFVKP